MMRIKKKKKNDLVVRRGNTNLGNRIFFQRIEYFIIVKYFFISVTFPPQLGLG